jgi:putative acetyltransferase
VDVEIRSYRPGDGAAVAAVMFSSVREGALADYSDEQVRAWLPSEPSAAWFDRRANDGRLVLVATDREGTIVAYGDLEPDGHLDHLYCLPKRIGHRVASKLYDQLEDDARRRGLPRIFVEASEAARRLFTRKEFVLIERHDFERHGVALHNYTMEKVLPTPPTAR